MKENPVTTDIPVIFISALNEVFDKVKAFSIGGVDYISKPFQVEEVLVRVENQLSRRRLQHQLERALEQERTLNQRIEKLAALEERNRIARDIHDSLGHALVALNIQIESVLSLWQNNELEEAYEFLVEAKQLGSNALQSVRQSVSAIRSDPLQGKSLEESIMALAKEFQNTTGIEPECQILLTRPLSSQVSAVLYRIVQEGLTNICKHANPSTVQICLRATESGRKLIIKDNGKGFHINANRSGFGLQGMRERVAGLGGELNIESEPGQGCCITVSLPEE